MKFTELFNTPRPLIGCIHLLALPGSPRYGGRMGEVYDTALSEVETFKHHSIDGLIVENFRDKPFYPDRIPGETIAALAALTREVVKAANVPVGVNALRNDAQAAVAIATPAGAAPPRLLIPVHRATPLVLTSAAALPSLSRDAGEGGAASGHMMAARPSPFPLPCAVIGRGRPRRDEGEGFE